MNNFYYITCVKRLGNHDGCTTMGRDNPGKQQIAEITNLKFTNNVIVLRKFTHFVFLSLP